MSTLPQVRLHLFHARDAMTSVILRQGPTRLWRMILWDRETDTFQDGQWLKHKVYPERCDLSPDGRHFLYFTLDGQWNAPAKGSYTVISQPPYFTALRLFPQGDTWGGGGFFVDATRFFIQSSGRPTAPSKSEDGLEQVFADPPASGNPTDFSDHKGKPLSLPQATRDWLALGHPAPVLDFVTDGPCLYRLDPDGCRLIRDFSDMAFERILAPYALTDAWHPLDEVAR
jgi:hypothetical protein